MNSCENFQLVISTLSPLHLGTGRYYDPLSYYPDAGCLRLFDLSRLARQSPPWLAELGEQAMALRGNGGAGLLRFRRRLRERKSDLQPALVGSLRISDGLLREIQSKWLAENNQGLNQFLIDRTAFVSGSGQPYIPGSAIKGALRTAVLNGLNQGQARNEARNNELQSSLLGGAFAFDPFRLVHVGDAMPAPGRVVKTEVLQALNRRRVLPPGAPDKDGVPQILQCIPAFSMRAFNSSVQIISGEQWSVPLRRRLSLPQIMGHCNDFYREIWNDEIERFDSRGLCREWKDKAEDSLRKLRVMMDHNDACILRLGRHSGSLSVTVKGVRKISIKQGSGPSRIASEPTTLWFSRRDARSGIIPFGWVVMYVKNIPGVA